MLLRAELATHASNLDLVAHAAATTLGLEPNNFAWIEGQYREPKNKLVTDPAIPQETHYFLSSAAYYGNHDTERSSGDILAHIMEPTPSGVINLRGDTPQVPYIGRTLIASEGVVTVKTLPPPHREKRPPQASSIQAIEYNRRTSEVAVWTEESMNTCASPEQNLSELPAELQARYLAAAVYTVKATAAMFEWIVRGDARQFAWHVY